MKNKMPLDGLGLGHDSGSVHCDMLKMLCFRTAWGGYLLVMGLSLQPMQSLLKMFLQMLLLEAFLPK